MKTVKKLIFSIVVIAFIAGCDDPVERGQIQPVVATPIETPLNIKAQITCSDFDMNDGCNFDVIGKTSCNLSENIKIRLHGNLNVINDQTEAIQFEFKNGYFELIDDDQFSYMSGTLRGDVYRSYNELKVNGLIEVNFGKGTFEADGGELGISIIGVLDQHDESILNLNIEIKGFFEKSAPSIS